MLLSPFKVLFYLFIGLLLAVLVDLIVINLDTPVIDFRHNAERIDDERRQLADRSATGRSLVNPEPFAMKLKQLVQDLRSKINSSDDSPKVKPLARLVDYWKEFTESLLVTFEVFGLRLVSLFTMLPALFVVCLVASIDGLVRRSVRKSGAGIESARIYHFAKRSIKPFLVWTTLTYFTLPIVVNVSWLFVGWLVVCPILLSLLISRFKKYV